MAKQKLGFWQEFWVKHLENGYAKTTSVLCQIESRGECCYCALGLAEEIAYVNFPDKVEVHYNKVGDPCTVAYRDRDSGDFPTTKFLTPFATELFAFTREGQVKVANLNDMGYSFAEIAQVVRASPKEYFTRAA